jgi:catechol 2,3-dioxygenase-like lactoylglutathione lyase family enzyme
MSPPGKTAMAMKLGTVVQVAYLVDDVRVAAADWAARLGAGPFVVREHPPMQSVDASGAAGCFVHSSAYGQWGAVQIELVQVHAATPAPLESALGTAGGVHHVAMLVPDFDAAQQRLTRLGWPAVMTATTSSGMRFAFHDARPNLGHLIEIYEPTKALVRLYADVAAAAEGWDGERPVREQL